MPVLKLPSAARDRTVLRHALEKKQQAAKKKANSEELAFLLAITGGEGVCLCLSNRVKTCLTRQALSICFFVVLSISVESPVQNSQF